MGKHILRWTKNEHVAKSDARLHRLITGRGVDMICSELLSNAFEHGWHMDNPDQIVTKATLPRYIGVLEGICVGGGEPYQELRQHLKRSLIADVKRASMSKTLESVADDVIEDLRRILTEIPLAGSSGSPGIELAVANRLRLEQLQPYTFYWPRPFIIAKLCTPDSSLLALQADAIHRHLLPVERALYTNSSQGRYPLLQLVVADLGTGFGGNAALVDKWIASGAILPGRLCERSEQEAFLVQYALRPDVSTKRASAYKHWRGYDPGANVSQVPESPSEEYMNRLRPVVHGLSEVGSVVARFGGYWRVHSNGVAVNINYTLTHPRRPKCLSLGGLQFRTLTRLILPKKNVASVRILVESASPQTCWRSAG